MSDLFDGRAYSLLDIHIRSGGDGRTVEAYAAVWDSPTQISDAHGDYMEEIDRRAFARTIAHRGDKPWPVLFNHGLTLHGTPSERGTMPIGVSVEPPRADARGLVTVSRYTPGDLADEALEAIRSEDGRKW
jgi:phage head maturation protease